MATITARVDDEIKEQFQLAAEEIGIPASALIWAWIRQFLRDKKLELQLPDDCLSAWYDTKETVDFEDTPATEVIAFLSSHQELWANNDKNTSHRWPEHNKVK